MAENKVENDVLYGFNPPWKTNPVFLEAMIMCILAGDKELNTPVREWGKAQPIKSKDEKDTHKVQKR